MQCKAKEVKFLATIQPFIHSLLPLYPLSSTGECYQQVIRNTYCGKHPEEQLRFYCLKCECTICRDCRMTNHAEGHKTLDMVDLQQSAKDLVSRVNEIIVENFVPVLTTNTQFFKKEFEEKKATKAAFAAAIAERERVSLFSIPACLSFVVVVVVVVMVMFKLFVVVVVRIEDFDVMASCCRFLFIAFAVVVAVVFKRNLLLLLLCGFGVRSHKTEDRFITLYVFLALKKSVCLWRITLGLEGRVTVVFTVQSAKLACDGYLNC